MTALRVLAVSKIFPNAEEPLSAPFNRQQFAALGQRCELEVLASIPWYPGASLLRRWSAAGRLTAVPAEERIDGLRVGHPRYLFVPRVGHSYAWLLYAASLLVPLVRRRKVDVLLASWAYPDGAAIIALGRLLGLPVVVKLHGSDVNVVAAMPGPRRALAKLLPQASRVVAVSRALGDKVVALGVDPARVVLVGNGVDGSLFAPSDKAAARRALGLSEEHRWIVYAGRLQEEKGVGDLVTAFDALAAARPDVALAFVGDGPARAQCEALAQRHGERVRVVGARPLAEVPRWFAAADVVTLPSWNEGVPNVLLEARAAGRPVVATRVGGIPEVVEGPLAGELVAPHAPVELAEALLRVATATHDAGAIAAGARGGWAESAARLHEVLLAARAEHQRREPLVGGGADRGAQTRVAP